MRPSARPRGTMVTLCTGSLPGILIAVVFFCSAPLARQWPLPPFMAQSFADLVVLVPGVLGFLFYQGYRTNGRLSLDGVVLYRDRLPWWQFVGLIPLILVAAGGLTVHWAPVPYRNSMGYRRRLRAFSEFAFAAARRSDAHYRGDHASDAGRDLSRRQSRPGAGSFLSAT